MKKQVLFSILFVVTFLFSANVFAQYPIASYDKPVEPGTYFTMTQSANPTMSAEKRKMVINSTNPNSASTGNTVTFIVFSLDMQDFRGPFTIEAGSSKIVEIDDRLWGLQVMDQTGSCLMSVFTSSIE